MADITRSDFMKGCAAGLCSCAAMLVAPLPANAETTNPEAEWLREQLNGVRIRYAKLVEVLDHELNQDQKQKVFQGLGHQCVQLFRDQTIDKYKGNIDGFLQSIQAPGGWVAKVDYDKAAGTIRIEDKANKCTCPMVRNDLTPSLQCICTLTWQKETYSGILGRPVEATLEESILRGGKRCVFLIKIL
jgi:hypothetical protein